MINKDAADAIFDGDVGDAHFYRIKVKSIDWEDVYIFDTAHECVTQAFLHAEDIAEELGLETGDEDEIEVVLGKTWRH